MDGRLKETVENAEWEKALKDIIVATTKEKGKATEVVEKKAQAFKKAWALAKKKFAEMEMKLRGMKLKLVKVESLNLAQANNEGFADAENSIEPIVLQAPRHGFGEGWMAALQAMGVPVDSPLRNPDQVPFPDPFSLYPRPLGATDEEETPNMRELVRVIDSHMKLVDLEVTSGRHAGAQSTEDVQIQQPPTA